MSFQSQNSGWGANGTYQGSPAPYSDTDDYAAAHQQVYDNVHKLTEEFSGLSRMAQAIGSAKDGQQFREQLKQRISADNALIRETKVALRDLGALAGAIPNPATRKERKVIVEKLTADFKTFEDRFGQLVAVTQSKMEEIPFPGAARGPQTGGAYNPFFSYDSEADKEEARRREQEHVQLEDDRAYQAAIIAERDAEIRAIQMSDVNEIFSQLGRLVEDQGEMIDNIQTNISNASEQVQVAVGEINQASEYQQSSRRKLCFIAIFVVIVVAVVVLVIVLTLPKSKKK